MFRNFFFYPYGDRVWGRRVAGVVFLMTLFASTLATLYPLLWPGSEGYVCEGVAVLFFLQSVYGIIYGGVVGMAQRSLATHEYAPERWRLSGGAFLWVLVGWVLGFLVWVTMPVSHLSPFLRLITEASAFTSLLLTTLISPFAFGTLFQSLFAHFYNKEVKAYRQSLVEEEAERWAGVVEAEKWAELERLDRLTYWPDQVCLETRDAWDEWDD